jgi:hypothetical protein
VFFVHLSGKERSIIDYAKGSQILGYKDTDLIGMEVINLMPIKYQALHQKGRIFGKFKTPFDQTGLSNKVGTVLFLNKRGLILQFLMKIRVVVDSQGEIFLVVLAREIN